MPNLKYELLADDTVKSWDGRTLFRIKALVAIAAFGVSAGDLGGYIEAEKNLQVSGDAWVSGNARVYGNAQVSGDAQVYGNAQVSGDARVYGNAWVSGNALVYGNAQVSGDARVYGNARVSGDARVSGNALVSPVTITGLTWTVTIADQEMVIGCQHHEISAWLAFSDREIIAMDRQALKFWRAYKPVIEAICTDTGRPFAKVDAPAECAAQ